jgi:hypothetical protein
VWFEKNKNTMSKNIEKYNAVPANSMIIADFGRVDYCDSYRITKSTNDTPEQFAAQLFNLPKWVKWLMCVRNCLVRPFGLKTEKEPESDTIFPIIARTDNEILMEGNDKHLNFRVSVLIDSKKLFIYTTTAVHYNNNWGKVYFLIIKPFHKIIVKSAMRNLCL